MEVAESYHELGVGLTDASFVGLAAHVDAKRITSFDERHFRAMRPLSAGAAFHLVPADG